MDDNDPILRDLETVLTYGGREVTWIVPANSVIVPGTGAHLLDGAVISHWTAD